MSEAIKNAIEAMEFAQHAVGPLHRVATKKLRESIAELKAIPQAQASKPIAAVTGWYDGRCVIEPLDRALAIPVGTALYSQPQAQAGDGEVVAVCEIEEFIHSSQFDVERDNVSGVIYADDLRAWLSRWQTLKTKITPITAGSGE